MSVITKDAWMDQDWSQLAGQIDTSLDLEHLASAMASRGIQLEIRESSHYQGGRYLCVYEGAPDFSLEKLPGEFLARADAESIEQLRIAARRVSGALTALNIRHRFELYGAESELVGYMHLRWPEKCDSPQNPG